jgi:DNA segregation ATPase FtsK/SpoIIIE-like protein
MNKRNKNLNAYSLIIGRDKKGKKIKYNLFEDGTFAISGIEESGKTTFLKNLIKQVSNKYKKDIKLLIACSKKKEFAELINQTNLLVPIITNSKDIEKQFKWLNEELEKRYDILQEALKRNFIYYNKSSKKKMLPIIFFIDDFSCQLLNNKKFKENLRQLLWLGKGVGIFIIFSIHGDMFKNQNNDNFGMIMANISTRLTFKLKTKRQSKNLLRYAGAEKLKPFGEALYENVDMIKAEFCNTISK